MPLGEVAMDIESGEMEVWEARVSQKGILPNQE